MTPFLEILGKLTHVTLTDVGEVVMAATLLGEQLGTEDENVNNYYIKTYNPNIHTNIMLM